MLLACLLVLVTGLSLRLLVFPTSDPIRPTDAVVLLAGAPETRLPVAVALAKKGSGVLVISASSGGVNAPARRLCTSPPADVVVRCFVPEAPENTRSEARAIGDLVTEQNWTRIAVVTSTYHMARAGLLIRRCTHAEVLMVEARPLVSGLQWTKYVTVEIGGLAVAAANRSC